jgi:L-amino acid N-acyltransferase YncA
MQQNKYVDEMTLSHWPQVLEIYKSGIESGHATFETQLPTWEQWDQGHHPFARLVLLENEELLGWAALSPVSRRQVYSGVAEVSVYVAHRFHRQGTGRILLSSLITAAEENGIWTLQASIFPENTGSVQLHLSCGFREVGRRERIAQLNGAWRDTVLFERRSNLRTDD